MLYSRRNRLELFNDIIILFGKWRIIFLGFPMYGRVIRALCSLGTRPLRSRFFVGFIFRLCGACWGGHGCLRPTRRIRCQTFSFRTPDYSSSLIRNTYIRFQSMSSRRIRTWSLKSRRARIAYIIYDHIICLRRLQLVLFAHNFLPIMNFRSL